MLSRIFEPLSQGVGDRTREGLGLGLYLTGHGYFAGDPGGGEGVFDRCLTKLAQSADLREIVRDAAVKQHEAADRSGR